MTSANRPASLRRATLTELRTALGDLELHVRAGHGPVVILRQDKPAWAMVGLADLARLLGVDEAALMAALAEEENA